MFFFNPPLFMPLCLCVGRYSLDIPDTINGCLEKIPWMHVCDEGFTIKRHEVGRIWLLPACKSYDKVGWISNDPVKYQISSRTSSLKDNLDVLSHLQSCHLGTCQNTMPESSNNPAAGETKVTAATTSSFAPVEINGNWFWKDGKRVCFDLHIWIHV